eukprot:GHVU01141639.1.p1 GENE.GHVU01141639.1~~GHVU01141639.1.p1  ORF type:complete len:150 (+),score=6.76 GHVU01141639.1:49-498(+)
MLLVVHQNISGLVRQAMSEDVSQGCVGVLGCPKVSKLVQSKCLDVYLVDICVLQVTPPATNALHRQPRGSTGARGSGEYNPRLFNHLSGVRIPLPEAPPPTGVGRSRLPAADEPAGEFGGGDAAGGDASRKRRAAPDYLGKVCYCCPRD